MSRYINYIFLGVATLSAIILKTVMSFFIIDADSGFIKNENLAVAIFIIVLLILAAAAVCFFGANTHISKGKKPQFKGVFPCIISLLLGFAMIVAAFLESTLPAFQKNLESILSLAFGFYLIYTAIGFIAKIKTSGSLLIISVVYWLVKLVNIFTVCSTLSNTFDNIFEIFTLCSVLYFFLYLSKAVSLEPDIKTQKTLNAISYLACFMTFACSLPKAIVVLTNNQAILGDNKSFLILLLTGVYILTFIIKNKPKIS